MEKKLENPLFFKEKGPLGGSGGTVYAYRTPLVGCTVKKKHDRHTDSRFSLLEDNSPRDGRDHNTKAARDEGVEKHSCQIELRGAHVKLVYYNNKPVLRAYSMLHVTAVLHVRSEDERADTYTYMLR